MKTNPMNQIANALAGGKETAKNTPAKPGKMHTKEIVLKRGAEGGYIATHRLESRGKGEDYMGSSTKDYPIHSKRALHQHIDKHFGDDSACVEPDADDKGGK